MALIGNEVLWVVPVSANGRLAAEQLQTSTGAIAALADAANVPAVINTAISTAGNGTLSAAGIVGGVITRTGPSADFTDATATAVQIVAALVAYVEDMSFVLSIRNATIYSQTITAASGVTLSGTAYVTGGTEAKYLVTITSPTAVTMLYLGSDFLADAVGGVGDIVLGNGKAIKTDATTAHTGLIQAYDVNGAAYKTFATLTNGDTPSFAIAAPSGGTVTVDGAAIGGTTPAAAAFTTIAATDNITATTANKYVLTSRGNALTAAGATRTDAFQLAAAVNNITTADSGTGVILPVGVVGMEVWVYNNGANPVQVYATASETINGTAGSTGVALTNAKTGVYHFMATNTWVGLMLN
ncbi:MAG: hypothetical protein WC100_01605 [Sterolibacterium sp.]